MTEKESSWLTIGQAAKYLGISRDTLRRWEKRGQLKAVRSPSNRRFYTKNQLDSLLGKEPVKNVKPGKVKMGLTSREKLVVYAILACLAVIIAGIILIF